MSAVVVLGGVQTTLTGWDVLWALLVALAVIVVARVTNTVFTTFTTEKLWDVFTDRAASLTWRFGCEDELRRRHWTTRDADGLPVTNPLEVTR
jgi:hypothetical protein